MNTLCIGTHISSSGGLLKNIQHAYEKYHARALQCFIGNPQSGTMTDRVYQSYMDTGHMIQAYLARHNIQLFIHAPYVWNFAKDPETDDAWWVRNMVKTLKVADKIGAQGCVLHMGKSVKLPTERAKQYFVASLGAVIDHQKADEIQAKVFVETAAGQGTELFATMDGSLDALAELCTYFDEDDWKNHISFCVDTCHIYAAGYDIATDRFWKEWEEKVGLEKLGVLHINNSVGVCGCKKDRHAALKHGKIPLDAFAKFVQEAHIHRIPMVIETELSIYDIPNLAEMILGKPVIKEDYDTWLAKQKMGDMFGNLQIAE